MTDRRDRRLGWFSKAERGVLPVTLCCGLSSLSPHLMGAESDVGVKVSGIVGGTRSAREGVVYIATNLDDDPSTEDRACTGSIIGPRLVLTARHCVSAFTEGTFECSILGNVDGSSTRNPPGAGAVGFPYDPEAIRVYLGPVGPAFIDKTDPAALRIARVFTIETTDICRNDLALLELEEAVEVPPLALRLASGVRPRDKTRLVGYGFNEDQDNTQHESVDIRIVGVGPSEFFPTEGQAPPRTFSVSTGPCPGDSGGPALAEGSEAVLGVFSFFKGSCDSNTVYNYYTHLAPFADFVLGVFDDVGDEPLLETDSSGGPGGASGSGGQGAVPQSGGAAGAPVGSLGGEPGTGGGSRGACSISFSGDPKGVSFLGMGIFGSWMRRRWIRRKRDG